MVQTKPTEEANYNRCLTNLIHKMLIECKARIMNKGKRGMKGEERG
jgi:hypothetical protein